MSLTDNILATTRRLFLRVKIGEVLLYPSYPESLGFGLPPGVISIQFGKSFDSPIPVCSIRVTSRLPHWVRRGMPVHVDLGYDGLGAKVFRGTVQSRSREFDQGLIHCTGLLYNAFNLVEIPARDVNGLTVSQALAGVLDYLGLTDRNLVSIPAFTLGTASDAILERSTAAQMLQQLMDIDGLVLWESGNGIIYIAPLENIAAANPFRTYSTDDTPTARILRGSDIEDPTFLRTRVVVTGATTAEGTGVGDTTSRTVTATATLVNSPLVQPPLPSGTYLDAEFSNPLIDTTAKAQAVATRLMNKYGRVPRQLTLEVPGDPELELGQTLELSFPELEAVGRFLIHGIEHNLDEHDFVTRLQLRGGDETSGVIRLNPIADFSYSIHRQIIGDRVYALVTFDASRSYDPDGTIASYAWSDDETTSPEIHISTASVQTVRIDPSTITGDWTVTLTVTDNDGLTSALSRVIPVAGTASAVHVPAVFAALDNKASATPNGGEKWNDQTASDCTVVAARQPDGVTYGHACFGFTDGSIKRTTDFCLTALTTVLAAVGSPIVAICYDWRSPILVYALTQDWRLYYSTNAGLTWNQFANLATNFGLSGSAQARAMGVTRGALYTFGGDAVGGVVIGRNLTKLAIGGELFADYPGGVTTRIVDFADKDDGGPMVIILENVSGSMVGLYSSVDPNDQTLWKRATGLDGGLVTGRYVVPDFLPSRFHAAFDDRNVWDTTNGISWVKRVDKMPAGVTPRSAIMMSDPALGFPEMPTAYLVAATNAGATVGIYISLDLDSHTPQLLRPATGYDTWPASAIGRQVSLGPAQGRTGRLVFSALVTDPNRAILWRLNEVNWRKTSLNIGNGYNFVKVRVTSSLTWFFFYLPNRTNYENAVCLRTEDGMTSASTLTPPAGEAWQSICRAADGRLWGLTIVIATPTTAKVYYSDNDGDSWTLSKTETAGTNQRLHTIVAHPHKQDRILVYGTLNAGEDGVKCLFTTDRGTTWSTNSVNSVLGATVGHSAEMVMFQNDRILIAGVQLSTGIGVITSDDNGAIWIQRYNSGDVTDSIVGPTGNRSSSRLYFLLNDASAGTSKIFESRDLGQTWNDMVKNVPRYSAGKKYLGGLVYDEREDALYALAEGGQTVNERLVMRLSPVIGGPTVGDWQDFSDTALPVGAYTTFTIAAASQALAVIP